MSFGFGAKPAFGATTTTAGGLFGGFGTNTATTSSSFGGFGTAASTAAPAFGGFGTTATATSAPAFGGFGTTTTSAAPSFGGFGTTTGFNKPTTGFGTGTTTTTGFGAIGGTTGIGTSLLNTQQQQQQQQPQNSVLQVASAVSLPVIFNDERDALLAKWNQLQASWGTGKGFYSSQGHSVNFDTDNPFCRFKAVGYSVIPQSKNRDGLVAFIFNKKEADIKAVQTQIVDNLRKVLGNKPNLMVNVESIKELPDGKTELVAYVQEQSSVGSVRRIPASEVFAFFKQPTHIAQLQQIGVVNLLPKMGFTADQLKRYLDNPQQGIDPLLWQQAKLDNPNPEQLIPVPMVGFKELHKRLKHQEQQTKMHQATLNKITTDIASLQQSHTNVVAKLEQYKRKHLEMGHRVLQVLVRQEVHRKLGYAVQVEEEQLRVQLEALQAQLNAPTQFKGRLNELMSQMRMQNQLGAGRLDSSYQMDEPVQQEIRQHLSLQQEGLQHLISIIKDDLDDLGMIEQGLTEIPPRR